jgi:hypothetical protein
MEVVVMAPPGSDFGEPRPVSTGLIAEHLLDRRVHKNAIDFGKRRCQLYQVGVNRPPLIKIDIEGIAQH